ncbi:hypothetical protein CDL15_Pgr012073 [Punica granatum]|uniref:ABC-type xenobiotic transporter n=1 Tax=Punica granatum TaxID=22663 RepID=A0A218XLI8_PUNGR|nr:hypothetical protein CDL15_Pgr012073 [Punica granatum]
MDRERYEVVLEECSLEDLEVLSFVDQAVIGERGINLSGGQKQRIQIAQALYQDVDICLFEDPFSAVDAHTVSHLFKECLLCQLSTKTVIYVTHQVELLPVADLILAKNGNIQTTEKLDKAGQLVQEEEREKGSIGFSVYWKYITTAYGGALLPFILLGHVMFQGLQILSNYWMAWASPVSMDTKPAVQWSTVMPVYIAFSIGSLLCVLMRSMLRTNAGYKTVTLLFEKMHRCIFRSPISFFNTIPSGRILNRASTDQSTLDLRIPDVIAGFAFILIRLLRVIVVSQVAWQVFIVCIPVVAASLWYQEYYIASAWELSRLVGVYKAPMIQHFAEPIAGSTTIRSFDQESRFIETNVKLSIDYSLLKFHSARAMEWLALCLDMLSSIMFGFCLILLVSAPEGLISPAIAGLDVIYGLSMDMLIAWAYGALYTTIMSELPLVIEETRPERSWPSTGEIDIHHLQIRYVPHMPLVLGGISCKFPGGMKTGIVGRTGSRKSTLIQTIFRIVDPAGGHITIDGIDICSMGVHDLRPEAEHYPTRANHALDKCQLGYEVRKKEGKLDSAGLVCEYDSPKKLLEDKSSSFSQLVAEYTMRSNSTFKQQ